MEYLSVIHWKLGPRDGKTMIRKRISELLPGIFDADPPSIQGEDPVVLTASFIKNIDVHFLPAGGKVPSRRSDLDNVTLHPAYGSYGILKKIVGSTPKEYYKTLWSKSAEVPIWIGSCRFEQPFDDMLLAFSETKFGGARVTHGTREALITLGDAVGLISEGKLSARMSTSEVGSVPIFISKDRRIIESIREMVSHNIRRLFVEEEEGRFISDRTLIDYMFSPQRLGVARDHPELWIDEAIEKLGTKRPGRCGTGSLDEAAKVMGPAPDDCLMTDEGRVISRWDIVVKPWRAGKLEAA
jgi:CBS domain-containing protein